MEIWSLWVYGSVNFMDRSLVVLWFSLLFSGNLISWTFDVNNNCKINDKDNDNSNGNNYHEEVLLGYTGFILLGTTYYDLRC